MQSEVTHHNFYDVIWRHIIAAKQRHHFVRKPQLNRQVCIFIGHWNWNASLAEYLYTKRYSIQQVYGRLLSKKNVCLSQAGVNSLCYNVVSILQLLLYNRKNMNEPTTNSKSTLCLCFHWKGMIELEYLENRVNISDEGEIILERWIQIHFNHFTLFSSMNKWIEWIQV